MRSSSAATQRGQHLRPLSRGRVFFWGLFALMLALAPLLFRSSLALTMLAQIGYLIIICLSYNILLGQGGMLSFGHAEARRDKCRSNDAIN